MPNIALKNHILILGGSEMRRESLESSITNRIERKRGDFFLRSDFKDYSGYDHVGRLRDIGSHEL